MKHKVSRYFSQVVVACYKNVHDNIVYMDVVCRLSEIRRDIPTPLHHHYAQPHVGASCRYFITDVCGKIVCETRLDGAYCTFLPFSARVLDYAEPDGLVMRFPVHAECIGPDYKPFAYLAIE